MNLLRKTTLNATVMITFFWTFIIHQIMYYFVVFFGGVYFSSYIHNIHKYIYAFSFKSVWWNRTDETEKRHIFPKYFRSQLEPSLREGIMKWQTQWRVICIYITSRIKNKWWGENLLKKRVLREARGRIGRKSVKGILESVCNIRSWFWWKKVC